MQKKPNLASMMDFSYIGYLIKISIAFAASFWLTVPAMVQLLLLCMALDFATGLVSNWGHISSDISYAGLRKKFLILVMVTTAEVISRILNVPISLGNIVAGAYAVNECISITENCAKAGVPIPPALLDALLKTKSITGRGTNVAVVLHKLESVESTVTVAQDGGTHTDIKSSSSETVSKP